MPRRLRRDEPGAWHHVINRGVARRSLFETVRDVRKFLAALAWRVRAGDIEIHAYSILPNHFHLLVRSPTGRLSAAMQRAMEAYARWFNRSRDRDGPVFRGRFTNRIVDSDAYWVDVILYIDHNPVKAGLAASATDYPHGSAWHYFRGTSPPWLTRTEVEAHVRPRWDRELRPAHYAAFCSRDLSPGERWLMERRIEEMDLEGPDEAAGLLDGASPRLLRWFTEQARRADGTKPGVPIVAPTTLQRLVSERGEVDPRWWTSPRATPPTLREVLLVGLLRRGSGLRLKEISDLTGLSVATVQNRQGQFRRALAEEGDLLEEVSDILVAARRLDRPEVRDTGSKLL